MGIKWTAGLRVDFEMEEGVSEHHAERRIVAGQFEQFVEAGIGAGKALVKPGSAKVVIVAQGATAW
jgi:hypothetical protein